MRELIPCQIDRTGGGGNDLKGIKFASICNIDREYCSTINARYYKGVATNHDNMVIVYEREED